MDLAQLRAVIDGDPILAGLIGAGLDQMVTDALNAPSAGHMAPARLSVEQFLALVDPAELPGPAAPERTFLDLALAQRSLLLTAELLDNLSLVFGPASKSIAALVAVAARPGSLAEELFGAPVAVGDVSACYADGRRAAYDAAQAPLNAVKAALDAAVSAYLRAAPGDAGAAALAVRAAQAAIKAEHERGGVVFGENEVPSVIELGRGRP